MNNRALIVEDVLEEHVNEAVSAAVRQNLGNQYMPFRVDRASPTGRHHSPELERSVFHASLLPAFPQIFCSPSLLASSLNPSVCTSPSKDFTCELHTLSSTKPG